MACIFSATLLLVNVGLRSSGVSAASTDAMAVPPAVLDPGSAKRSLDLYSVASSWPDRSLGNHRARLRIDPPSSTAAAGDGIVFARIQWRLPGLPMDERRQLVLVDEATGEAIKSHMIVSASWELCELLFEPEPPAPGSTPGARHFLLYYLPFDDAPCVTGPASSCTSQYKQHGGFHFGRARAFRQRARALLEKSGWRDVIVRAAVVAMHARTPKDAFFPMEVAATTAEVAAVASLAAAAGRRLLVWPEPREQPIRMLDRLPLGWIARGIGPANAQSFRGEAQRGEFFAFQIGVHAPLGAARILPTWTAFEAAAGGAVASALPKWRIRCINTPNGTAQAASGVTVAEGGVQPLWFGVDIPEDAPTGEYTGVLTITELPADPVAAGAATASGRGGGRGGGGRWAERVSVTIAVGHEVAVQHGDSDLWRHARLRWLDSNAGTGAVAVAEAVGANGAHRGRSDVWQPIELDEGEMTATAFGARRVRLNRRGLPAALTVGAIELLAAPMQVRLHADGGRGELRWANRAPPAFRRTSAGGVAWSARGRLMDTAGVSAEGGEGGGADGGRAAAGGAAATAPASGCHGLAVEISGEMQTDGLSHLAITLSMDDGDGGGDCTLGNVQLLMPLREAATRLINGFGWKGARRPRKVDFRWDDPVDHAQRGLNCRVWLGGADVGMQLNLQGVEQSRQASDSHCGQDDAGVLRCDDLTDAQFNVALGSTVWYNKNAGGASIRVERPSGGFLRRLRGGMGGRGDQGGMGGAAGDAGDAGEVAMLTVYTGRLVVARGAPVTLPARLLLTPVRGAGMPRVADFATRYFHMQRYTTVQQAVSAAPRPWIILHQGNQLNPYINYPFLTVEPLRKYIREAHAAGAKVKLYYTVRELSTSAAEFWALRSLGGEVLVPSRVEGGHAWLKEHVRTNYSASWHERLADGEVDSSVHTPAFTTRWDSYWVEGILWLVRNLDIDGIYLDGAPYERDVLRRLRAALEPLTAHRAEPFLLDLHASCAGNPHLPYTELYPYIDSIWYGEQCNYAAYSPEQWLAEVSGVPFGLPGQVLGTNKEQWQALTFGMTCRIYPDPHTCNPRPLWRALDALGLQSPRMLGWWDHECPVSVSVAGSGGGSAAGGSAAGGNEAHARATLFIGTGADGGKSFVVAVANWAPHPQQLALSFDWAALERLGLPQSAHGVPRATLRAPAILGFQEAGEWAASAAVLPTQAKGSGYGEGWLLSLTLP